MASDVPKSWRLLEKEIYLGVKDKWEVRMEVMKYLLGIFHNQKVNVFGLSEKSHLRTWISAEQKSMPSHLSGTVRNGKNSET